MWVTDDGIVVRINGRSSVDDGTPARMELTNIKREAQDASLFEVPKGAELISAAPTPEEIRLQSEMDKLNQIPPESGAALPPVSR